VSVVGLTVLVAHKFLQLLREDHKNLRPFIDECIASPLTSDVARGAPNHAPRRNSNVKSARAEGISS
jgi:hypothetical protein